MTFVGTVINFSGNGGEAILHRLAQARKCLGAWRHFLRSPRVALKKRLKLLISTVFASALWLPETWVPTKQPREHLTSWGVRMASSIAGVPSSPCSYGCRSILESPISKRSPTLCQHECHARRPTSVEAAHLCRAFSKIERSGPVLRCLSWWRREQARYHSKYDGLHPKRFKCWRWESQITASYVELHLPDDGSDTGWMATAKDKITQKENQEHFVDDSVLKYR